MTSKLDLDALKVLHRESNTPYGHMMDPVQRADVTRRRVKAKIQFMETWLEAFPAVVARLEAAEAVCDHVSGTYVGYRGHELLEAWRKICDGGGT